MIRVCLIMKSFSILRSGGKGRSANWPFCRTFTCSLEFSSYLLSCNMFNQTFLHHTNLIEIFDDNLSWKSDKERKRKLISCLHMTEVLRETNKMSLLPFHLDPHFFKKWVAAQNFSTINLFFLSFSNVQFVRSSGVDFSYNLADNFLNLHFR